LAEAPQVVAEPPDVDIGGRVAAPTDQRTVYMWTFSHTEVAGRKKPCDFSRAEIASILVDAYGSTGKVVDHWSVFLEKHRSSTRLEERDLHYHLIAQSSRTRWLDIARALRDKGVYMSVSTCQSRMSYWTAFGYCFAPTGKKPLTDLDQEYLTSSGHPEPPRRLQQARSGTRRLTPLQLQDGIVQNGLDTPVKLMAYATQQREQGDDLWATWVMKTPAAKLAETISTAMQMATAKKTLALSALNHMAVLKAAQDKVCVCEGHGVSGWEHVLEINGIQSEQYRRSVLKLFEGGGGKALNHFYTGQPSSGKTALVRPVMVLLAGLNVVSLCLMLSLAAYNW